MKLYLKVLANIESFFEEMIPLYNRFDTDSHSQFKKMCNISFKEGCDHYASGGAAGIYQFYHFDNKPLSCLTISRSMTLPKNQKNHTFKLEMVVDNKSYEPSWEGCPEGYLNEIQKYINSVRANIKKFKIKKPETLTLKEVIPNLDIYCNLAIETSDNKLFNILGGFGEQVIQDKLLSLVEEIKEKDNNDQNNLDRLKKLKVIFFMEKLSSDLPAPEVKSTKLKI